MLNLAGEGLVRRQRGAGTFIAPQPLHRHSGPLMSFTDDMRRRGLVASSRLLTAELREPDEDEAAALRVGPKQRVVAISRLRLADGEPMAIDDTVLTADCAGVLSENLETGSLHQALRALGRQPTTAICRISAREASGRDSALLEIPRRAAVLQEQRSISDESGAALEYTTSVYSAHRYVIDAVMTFAG